MAIYLTLGVELDGKRVSDAINMAYPSAHLQLCIVQMVCYSMKCVPQIDKKTVVPDLEAICGADKFEIAKARLNHLWDSKYPQVVKPWCNNWECLTVFLNCPQDIEKATYTIDYLNSVFCTAVNKRKIPSSDQAAFKVVCLATSWHLKSG